MCNNTPDEYKNAVKRQYEIEKNGEYSKFLLSPTQANLRKLCWERFKDNTNVSDLNIFRDFFEFDYNIQKKNQLKECTDKLKPVRAFFLGITESPNDETIELSAILLDFKFRPYNNFRKVKEGGNLDDSQIKDGNGDSGETTTKKETPLKDKPTGKLNLFRLFKRSKKTLIGTAVIFGLIASTICLLAFKKGCMQWSDNHYELVYCDKPLEGNLNEVILRDDNLLNFKKLIVCDTTTCFKPDGEAIVWYAKRGDKADFFNSNGNGRHPETKRSLRPITEYIKGKYKGNCPTK